MRRLYLSRPENNWWKPLQARLLYSTVQLFPVGGMFFHPFVFVVAVVFVADDQWCSCFSIAGRIPNHQHNTATIHAHHNSFETVTDRSGHCKQLWDLPNGLKMEVIVSSKSEDDIYSGHQTSDLLDTSRRESPLSPPIVFIHGSFHAAWCYSEHYMSYFSSLGYDCYSLSLRGTSGTIQPSSDYNGDKIKVEQHVEDVSMMLDRIYDIYNPSSSSSSSSVASTQGIVLPVVIAHSFGGLILMKLLEIRRIRERIAAVALLCSVPPSGNADMTKRFIQRDWLIALKIVWGFVFKAATFSPKICQQLFFDESVSTADVTRYMSCFKKDSKASLDLISLAEQLPSKQITPDGEASWINGGQSVTTSRSSYGAKTSRSAGDGSAIPARLVIGAENDFIVDQQGVEETAVYMGLRGLFGDSMVVEHASNSTVILTSGGAVLIPDMYHDVMLGSKWRRACIIISDWLKELRI